MGLLRTCLLLWLSPQQEFEYITTNVWLAAHLVLIISKGRNLLAALSGTTTFVKFRIGNDCANWHSSPMSASGRDCHWKEWPCLTPTPAAPCSCPAVILLSSCESLPCGLSSPGMRHKPMWKLPMEAAPLHWVGTRVAALVQSRTWCEKGRRNHGDGQLE